MALRSGLGAQLPKSKQDVVASEWRGDYCFGHLTVVNNTGGGITVANLVGHPISWVTANSAYEFTVAGDEADVVAIVLSALDKEITLADAESIELFCAIRGPATLFRGGIEASDYADGAYTMDDIETALAGLNPPILLIDEPDAYNSSVR